MSNIIVIIKNSLYIPAFLAGLGCPIQACQYLIYLMLIDFATGVIRAGMNHGWQSVKSSIGIAGIISKVTILLIPVVLIFTGKGIGMDFTALIGGVLYILVLSESYSILGNIQSIRSGKDIPEFDAVALTLKQVRNALLKILDKGKL